MDVNSLTSKYLYLVKIISISSQEKNFFFSIFKITKNLWIVQDDEKRTGFKKINKIKER